MRTQTEQGRMSHLRTPINKLVPVELCEDAIEDDVNIRFIDEQVIDDICVR